MERELHILILDTDPLDSELIEHELNKAGLKFYTKRVGTKKLFIKELRDSPRILFLQITSCPILMVFPHLKLSGEDTLIFRLYS